LSKDKSGEVLFAPELIDEIRQIGLHVKDTLKS
jgi:hypothetical protein